MSVVISLLAASPAPAARDAQAGQDWRDAGVAVAILSTSLIAMRQTSMAPLRLTGDSGDKMHILKRIVRGICG